jgi:hypothetical protein
MKFIINIIANLLDKKVIITKKTILDVHYFYDTGKNNPAIRFTRAVWGLK